MHFRTNLGLKRPYSSKQSYKVRDNKTTNSGKVASLIKSREHKSIDNDEEQGEEWGH